MCNIVSGSEYSNKWRLSQCCCGCTLRTGSLIIGWLDVIGAILYVIAAFLGQSGRDSSSYFSIGTLVLSALAGLCILIGIYKGIVKLLWVSVYLHLLLLIWCIIIAIIFFIHLIWVAGILSIIQMIFILYIYLVLRSTAYEMEGGGVTVNPA